MLERQRRRKQAVPFSQEPLLDRRLIQSRLSRLNLPFLPIPPRR
jgi:hypothetical protein